MSIHMFRLCGALALAALHALAMAQDTAPEGWNAHFQSTFISQRKPAFHSPYEGPNSLTGQAEQSYSLTATAALGLRLAPGTELYLDPEVTQGKPISHLQGLAGFSNGELAKTSGSQAKLYLARFFLRQSWALGGGGEDAPAESSANQLASRYAQRRAVLTVGKLSALDLFDANSLAHDPRTQFMNLALSTHGAYDYPADARGYTNGLALEYYDAGWALRAARFAEPQSPNQLPLDMHVLRHYGDQLEAARGYCLGEQSGTVRFLAFHMRALMSRYEDALAAQGVPELAAARTQEQDKWGAGVDVEHQLRRDLGVFLRAFGADGRTETYAFMEADASYSAGAVLRGASWGRAEDTVGLALASSTLSHAHQTYLARGGLSFFLGDGQLHYRAERDLEVYYSAALGGGLNLSLDAQRIVNPGYNADRGPAMFYAVRLHWEQ